MTNFSEIIFSAPKLTLIRPNLYLGNAEDRAQITKSPNNYPITAFLTLVGHPDYYGFSQDPRHIVFNIPMIDGAGNDEKRFNDAVLALDWLMLYQHCVLVHCAQGVSRSPTVVATWLCYKENKKFDAVVKELKIFRDIVNPNAALRQLAKKFLGEPF